jgi:hypothetical protein
MIGLFIVEGISALLVLALIVVVASAYPMPNGAPSPLAVLIGSVPLLCVAICWTACRLLLKRGQTLLAIVASVTPIAAMLLLAGAM